MPDIVLSTLNAKFIHAAFGLRYLFANLGALQSRARIVEFDINQKPLDIVEILLAQNPKIIGLGIYIWNVSEATEVVAAIKASRPEIKIILGGPEVSYETEGQQIVQLADHVITGEADLKFAEVCGELLKPLTPPGGARETIKNSFSPQNGEKVAEPDEGRLPKIIPAPLPEFSQLKLPYEFYDERDIAHRIIYVEASRGCPFTCEFCLSSLDIPVRAVPIDLFLAEMQKLLDRGVRQFKFVDRTFNLNIATSKAILEFFLARHRDGNFYHFEMIPDRLPEALREIIAKFPPGSLQFEVGIQTFNPTVGQLISRKQNYERLAENLRFLHHETKVHVHADLIVGLPGETVESFAEGFDKLVAMRPQEIQVGILKRLRGTPIVRHDAEWQMIYNPQPKYEILQNKLIDFATMQKLRRFAKYWDLIGNSGNFVETTPLIWSGSTRASACSDERLAHQPEMNEQLQNDRSLTRGASDCARGGRAPQSSFYSFMQLSEWLHERAGRTDGIALMRLMELLFEFLTQELKLDAQMVAETLWRDYKRGGRNDKPMFLREFLVDEESASPQRSSNLPKRQARHLTTS